MPWYSAIFPLLPLFFAFIFGLNAGSFINVVVARSPFDKSIVWPGSHCFSCLKPIKTWHNIPLLGYLLLRGRCANCKAGFSSRYFWIELFTGFAFAGIYVIDVLTQASDGPFVSGWFRMPGLKHPYHFPNDWTTIIKALFLWASHCALFSLLLASSLIDAEYRIIPTIITYPGTLLGVVLSVFFPWPWPNDVSAIPPILAVAPDWSDFLLVNTIPDGLQLWPALGAPPSWAPPGSWKLGLLNSLCGVVMGQLIVRGIKFFYESARGIEVIGLGDADLLMMIGAFLGWQVALMSMLMGALVSLLFIIPLAIYRYLTRKTYDPSLAFGPGISVAACLLWLVWPRFNEAIRMSFNGLTLAIVLGVPAVAFIIFGLLIRVNTIFSVNSGVINNSGTQTTGHTPGPNV